jgi:sugar O-acyltransferase (sialic acid O-acetyltransferase NeuD family)
MLVAGAKRHAKEILQLFHQLNKIDGLVFYDDVTIELPEFFYGKFRVIKTLDDAKIYFKSVDENFVLGLGQPFLRKILADKLTYSGGNLCSIISNEALIGNYNVQLENGLNIMNKVMISNDVFVGKGSLINANSSLHHDVKIGCFCEISPSSVLLGGCEIGSFTTIGANVTILPNVKIGRNCIVGAGAVVTKNIPDNCLALGVPAKVVKELESLDL